MRDSASPEFHGSETRLPDGPINHFDAQKAFELGDSFNFLWFDASIAKIALNYLLLDMTTPEVFVLSPLRMISMS